MTAPRAFYSTNVKKRPVALLIGAVTRYITADDARELQASLRNAIAAAEAFEGAPRRSRLARLVSEIKWGRFFNGEIAQRRK